MHENLRDLQSHRLCRYHANLSQVTLHIFQSIWQEDIKVSKLCNVSKTYFISNVTEAREIILVSSKRHRSLSLVKIISYVILKAKKYCM